MIDPEEEAIAREIARSQGIPEEEFLWFWNLNGEEIPEDQKPQWLKDREAVIEAEEQLPENRARTELSRTRFLALVSAHYMIKERDADFT
jgi:hypothetical protein